MEYTAVSRIPAIDIHSHVGKAHGAMPLDLIENGSEAYLLRTMAISRIDVSVNSSRFAIMPRGSGHTMEGNRQMLSLAEKCPHIWMWVIVDPHEPQTFSQAAELLSHPKVLGIKVHPEEHQYDLSKHGDALFSLAAAHGVPLLGHSGASCCMPETYGFYADRYPEIPVIAAHLGCSWDGDYSHQIRAVEENRAGNLYTDTSSMRSIFSNLLEYAVARIGAGRILFGTDSSNYFSPCQRVRIDCADIPDSDKTAILRGNACRLFPCLNADIEPV